jgi:hypothetical protein
MRSTSLSALIVERSDGYVMAFDAQYLLASFRIWDDPNDLVRSLPDTASARSAP